MAVQHRNTPQNIVLIGFMGTGKSALGKQLAQALGWRLVDTDALVEKEAGRPITDLFAAEGETGFREREATALRSLDGSRGLVISTGGGAIVTDENRRLIARLGLVVWLNASEETIFQRVSRNTRRPLLHTPNPRQTLHDLLEARLPLYESLADLRLDTGSLSMSASVKAVRAALQKKSPAASDTP